MIRFISSDRYSSLQFLLEGLVKSLDGADSVCLINCTDELQPDQFQKLPCQFHEINHVAAIDELWNTLNPHAKEWWNLLEIADKQSIELPDFPGLKDIIMLLEIARIIDEISNKQLVFILPPPAHAVRLLEMAQTGKRLIEDFVEPLLNWWDKTKKSLSAVEALLRLKLPDSQQLRFNAIWSSRLERLQKISINRDLHQFILILDGLGCSHQFINHRLCLSGLHSVVPSHLLICDAHEDVEKEMNQIIQPQWMYFAVLNGNDTRFDIGKFNTFPKLISSQPVFDMSKETISLFLPGICKSLLSIQKTSSAIYIIYSGKKRVIELPNCFKDLNCAKACVDGWTLQLSFTRSN